MTDKQFRFARTSQCYCLGQRENACSKANCTHLLPFCSSLQAEVDTLSAQADRVPGGLIVLGSIHTEMTALLEDRNAPLFNRTTDEIELTHLDIASVLAILREHADTSPRALGNPRRIVSA